MVCPRPRGQGVRREGALTRARLREAGAHSASQRPLRMLGWCLRLSWEGGGRETEAHQTQGCPRPSQGWLCPGLQGLPGFPVTSLY